MLPLSLIIFIRKLENDAVGEVKEVSNAMQKEIVAVEKRRRQKLWNYRPDIEIPKVGCYLIKVTFIF